MTATLASARAGFWGLLAAGIWGTGALPPAQAQHLEVTSFYAWETRAVAGLSGLELSADGQAFTAISDEGWYLTGRLERRAGALTGVTLSEYLPLLGSDGHPSAGRRLKDWSDAEGLVTGPDGAFWVAFERWMRVEQFTTPTAPGTPLPPHDSFWHYPENYQFEALALHPDGLLYGFAEKPQNGGFAVYRFAETGWEVPGQITPAGWYAIVGADFDAQGRLFLLERRHILGKWWQSRIRLVPEITRPQRIQTLWESELGAYDNFEGIAVWQEGAATRVTLVADNNAWQDVTEFLELTLTP